MDSDITSHSVVIGLFYHKISGSSFRKTSKVSMSLNDIIDFILNYMYVNIRKGIRGGFCTCCIQSWEGYLIFFKYMYELSILLSLE